MPLLDALAAMWLADRQHESGGNPVLDLWKWHCICRECIDAYAEKHNRQSDLQQRIDQMIETRKRLGVE